MRRWFVWLPISAGLLALLIWRTQPWDAATLASGLDGWPLLLALLLNAVVIGLWAVRSGGLMTAVGSPLHWLEVVPVVSFANTINNLTPASSGEALRALILKRRYGVPYQSSVAVILAERLWAIWLIFVTATAAAVGTLIHGPGWWVPAAWLAAGVLAFTPSIAFRIGLRPGRAAARLARATASRRLQTAAASLAELDERMSQIVLDPSRSLRFVLSTAAILVVFTTQLWLILRALGVDLPVTGIWAADGLALCAGVISALPFGLGAADAVLVVLLTAQGVPATTAGAAAILLRAVTTLPLGIVGAASWIYLGRGAAVTPGDATGSPREPASL